MRKELSLTILFGGRDLLDRSGLGNFLNFKFKILIVFVDETCYFAELNSGLLYVKLVSL